MHDPVDIRRRIERLVARVDRRDDYGELLASGHVVRRVEKIEDLEAWRAEIRRQARKDKIKVRTGQNDRCVWALVVRTPRDGWRDEERQYGDLLCRVVPLAVELWHEPSVALRDGDEVICACDRCDALGYGDVADGVVGGPLFEDECPHEDPPKVTGLAFTYTVWPRTGRDRCLRTHDPRPPDRQKALARAAPNGDCRLAAHSHPLPRRAFPS